MTDSVQELLLGHLLGALDDPERESLQARLPRDPQLQRELEATRRLLEPLELIREDFVVPAGLAQRTCRAVFSQSRSTIPAPTARKPMSPEICPPSRISRIRRLDVAMAVGVFLAAALLSVPAIQTSRSSARLAGCQDNLRHLGTAMTEYSEKNQGYFPIVPAEGKLAAAGIYAPVLLRDGFLSQPSRLICPDSPLAGQKDLSIPSLDELHNAVGDKLVDLQHRMGGSYGYCLGHLRDGTYRATKNLRREQFALMSDAPGTEPPFQTDNHGGRGQNVLFEDGRVRFLASPKPRGFADDFFCNALGEVAAGLHPDDSVIGSSASPPIIYMSR